MLRRALRRGAQRLLWEFCVGSSRRETGGRGLLLEIGVSVFLVSLRDGSVQSITSRYQFDLLNEVHRSRNCRIQALGFYHKP